MPIPENDPRIRLLRTAFVVYYHNDLAKARQFLADFGFEIAEDRGDEVFYRGYGSEPFVYIARQAKGESEFGGAAYEVESRAELERAANIPGASAITSLEAPGGGEIVTLTDPVGHKVHLVHGQTRREPDEKHLEKLTVNYEDEKPRKGRFQRFEHGPAPVHRWGHYGVTYPEGKYQELFDWYTKTLALAVSDVVYKNDEPITCFFHIDRGLEFTDHHAFFFKMAKPGQKLNVAHAAFEVHDFDIQQLGHQHLVQKGYQLCWGVGRHVLGSQVFDYWFDPSMFILEHYADGDLVNSETKVAHVPAGPDALSVWGPPVPKVF
ncbi:Glyoxalase/Bleomycin resistance protein/Dihydroxybiphenyl dioxygenase [Plectosphaerella cucumerina]|uniref:Glyoxalase/Bleomycin resistance protein/Dihydroxybiphenyl dioxygenase n=1 Tax=Plectosphaerella cucumerina TaxID=40658 RepID=A0A8K0TBM5_9PEZI|nr:Glyoxalase/Bleomycin resistance protein/Dihydroxybiphenyl dioxygenase [Plectosphaerella cucumerina]